MSYEAPLMLHADAVRPEWIDYNGHMNVAYYALVFDHGLDVFFAMVGIGPEYLRTTNCSIFALDTRTLYLREVKVDDPLRSTFQLLDFDDKRIHYVEQLLHGREGWVSAIFEGVSLHVDLKERRALPFPDAVRQKLAQLKDAHRHLPRPERLGRPLGLARS